MTAAARALVASLALLLAACATPDASITFGDPENPGRITAMSGLSSRDAAHVAATQAFYSAKTSASKDVLKIKAQPGQQVTISGLEELTVSAPAVGGMPDQAPIAGPTEFSENVKAVGGLVRDVGSVVVPLKTIDAAADVLRGGQNAALESQRIQGGVAGAGIDAAGRPPIAVLPSEGFRVFGVE